MPNETKLADHLRTTPLLRKEKWIMASKACRWPGDDTPLTGLHGGTKAAALRAIKESRSPGSSVHRAPSKRAQEYQRAREIVAAQFDHLLSKLPPVTQPRKDRVRPKVAARGTAGTIERREWLRVHMEHQGERCFYCHTPMVRKPPEIERWRKPSLDHVVPLSAGGLDSFCNTVAACLGCNNAKGSLSVEEFKADMRALRQRVGAP